jgi:4-amino-4-deoxy-L-arabinose transferase-like glycosyltransferase
VVACLGIGVVAIAARAYELRDVPRLTDETDEVMRGWAIAQGQLLPLTNVDAYIGPLWNYLLALGFLLFGPSALLPRVVTLVAALATVAACGGLGHELALRLGRRDSAAALGLGAATMLATSSFHAVVGSRLAWSHALTPLAMTLAFWCLLRWERTRDGRSLAGLGLAYGLAVHTHLTALAFAPGLGIWALARWRSTLLGRWGWISLGMFVLVNAPLLAYNLTTGFGTLAAASEVQIAYAGSAGGSGAGYGRNLLALLTSWPLLLAGEIGDRRGQMLALDDPISFIYPALFGVGVVTMTVRRASSPLLPFASAAILMPIFNGKYEPLFNGRYLAPLLPMAFAMTTLGLVVAVERCSVRRAWRGAVIAAGVVGLAVPPLWSLGVYLRTSLDTGPNNRELYRAAEIAEAVATSKPVLVDATLSGTRLSTGRAGTGMLEYILVLDRGLTVQALQPADLAAAVERDEYDLAIVSSRLLARLDKEVILEDPPGEAEARRWRRLAFAVVRIVRPVSAPTSETSPPIGEPRK